MTTNFDISNDDIVQELNDWAFIANSTKTKANLVMLNGTVFAEAASEIEKLRRDKHYLVEGFLAAQQVNEELKNRIKFLEAEIAAIEARTDYA